MTLIKEIKSKINIVDLAKDLGLNPRQDNFIFSIYKEETSRSMKLYPETNSFYCYATGRWGDVINLFADKNNIEIGEAVKILSKRLGIDTNYKIEDELNNEKETIQPRNQMCTDKCIEIYETLERFCAGVDEKTVQYLTGPNRGLTQETITKFRIFVIKDLNKSINDLLSRFSMDELKLSGVFNEKTKFVFGKHSIIIPYLSNNRIDYLRGRSFPDLENKGASKYIGLKGHNAKRLFNFDILNSINDGNNVLLCEGEFDTMVANQQGFNAMGVPGVHNFPEKTIELLQKFNLFICFDNDEAGHSAAIKLANKINKRVNIISLKHHKDITELVASGKNLALDNTEDIEIKNIEPDKTSKLKLISGSELMKKEIPEMIWVVNQLMPEGLAILAGRPKVGKSFLALNIAISIATGTKALGLFDTNRNSVLYIALEDNLRRLKERIQSIVQYQDNKNLLDNLFFLEEGCDLPKLNENGIEELQKIISGRPNIKLIIVDTFGRSIADKSRKDKDKYRADYEISSQLQKMAMRNNICLLLLHHTKKGIEENVFDEISGTTGLSGAMDTMMVLKKKNSGYTLNITGRDVPETIYELEFNERNFIWNIKGKKNAYNLTSERAEIVNLFKKNNKQMRTGEIADLLGKEKSNISKMLIKLKEDGILGRLKYGTYELIQSQVASNYKQ